MIKFHLDRTAAAYAATSLGATMMNSVFGYYYVKIFLNYYNVTEGWFQVSQVVYMIWNTVNDPLFGYMQDNLDYAWAKSRRLSILYGAPFFGISFLVPWIPWSRYGGILSGLHLMFSLCLYDTLFTFVLLIHCSLFAELSRKHTDRVRLVKYSQYAGLCGSTSVFFCDYFSKGLDNFLNFQLVCTLIGILATVCMVYTGMNSETEYDKLNIPISNIDTEEDSDKSGVVSGFKHAWRQTWEVMRERDFLSFVTMNFFATYHAVFLSGFAIMICDQMIRTDIISPFMRSLFYGSLSFAPRVIIILIVPVVESVGYFRVIRMSFILKILLGLALFAVGPHPFYLMAFFLLTMISCSPAAMTNLILSDVIDKDKKLHNRRHPLSSMVFASNALVTKPAISIAPMITVWILNNYGYELVKGGKADEAVTGQLHHVMFILACVSSIFIGLMQLLLWSRYTIRNSHQVVTKSSNGDPLEIGTI